jgi:hypothetical protein
MRTIFDTRFYCQRDGVGYVERSWRAIAIEYSFYPVLGFALNSPAALIGLGAMVDAQGVFCLVFEIVALLASTTAKPPSLGAIPAFGFAPFHVSYLSKSYTHAVQL